MIRTIVFDMGGVVFALNYEGAVSRFEEIGVGNARQLLAPFAQAGLFGDLESGRITADEYRRELSRLAGRELTDEISRPISLPRPHLDSR